jgi:hypothetical protein
MAWLAFQHLTATTLANEFPIAHLNFASHRHDGRAALNWHSFEGIVVVVCGLCLRRYHTPVIRIVNYKVSVTPNGNCTFAREQTEKLRCSSAGNVDKAIQVQPSAFHAVRVQEIHPFFDTGNSVGDIDEGVFAKKLLLRVKWAMIRSNGIDRPER